MAVHTLLLITQGGMRSLGVDMWINARAVGGIVRPTGCGSLKAVGAVLEINSGRGTRTRTLVTSSGGEMTRIGFGSMVVKDGCTCKFMSTSKK